MLPTSQTSSLDHSKQPGETPISLQPQPSPIFIQRTLSGARPHETLDIRTKSSSSTVSQSISKPYQLSLNFNKRRIIDLTLSDDEDELISGPHKKSRSSSQSTESIVEPLGKSNGAISQVAAGKAIKSHETASASRPFHFASKSTKVREKDSVFPSPYSWGASSPRPTSAVSAVKIGPPQPSPAICRETFLRNLSVLRGVTIVNTLDDSSPPLDFKFIEENVIGKGVHRATDEFMSGCTCRKDNGRQIGCEYLACECLEDSITAKEGKKMFPYSAASKDPGCLRSFYLEGGFHIFECNKKCNCESNCKNRVVQHGRTVPLEIFKTSNRGWGLRCKVNLKTGQFIDTYRGEIITHEEAERRGAKRRRDDQDNYFFDLDRWEDESEGYVCDGMYMGGPTRFMNHSCDSNCRQMTVSYNHADVNIYDLAFFATEPIPAGTELTFDYSASVDEDLDDEDEDVEQSWVISEKKAQELEKRKGYRPSRCLCGAWNCRGYFFT